MFQLFSWCLVVLETSFFRGLISQLFSWCLVVLEAKMSGYYGYTCASRLCVHACR
nr:MAG: putative 6 kDa protein [Tomato fruit blotch virus]